MGCDFGTDFALAHHLRFNPRTHMGCDSEGSVINQRCYLVSIHAPTWGATPPKQKERPGSRVSIHAPTWGATENNQTYRLGYGVSIHAPTWGATQRQVRTEMFRLFQSTHPHGVRPTGQRNSAGWFQCFNPRTHMGCDVSAPAKYCPRKSFNPRTHMGCDSVMS